MAALRGGCGHYIFVLWFLLLSFFLSFSSPNLSGRRLDVYHTFISFIKMHKGRLTTYNASRANKINIV